MSRPAPANPAMACARIAALACLLPGLAVAGCGREPPHPGALDSLAPEHDSLDTIPVTVVSGKLGGRPFTMQDARFDVDRRPGRERIELRLSADAAGTACGPLSDKDTSAVWLRVPGKIDLPTGQLRIQPAKPGEFEAHMQVNQDGAWHGNGDAAALLNIRKFDPAVGMEGDLSVCFGDAEHSCVSGSFTAVPCSMAPDETPRAFGAVSKEEIEAIKARLADAGFEAGPTDAGADGDAGARH